MGDVNISLVNNTARVIHVGGVMLVPGIVTEVSAESLENEQVKMLMETPVEANSKVMMIEESQDAPTESSVQAPASAKPDATATKSGDSPKQSSETSATSKPASGTPKSS